MVRNFNSLAALVAFVAMTALPESLSQSKPDLQSFFENKIGLTLDQISAIRNGKPITKNLPPRNPSEVYLFGAIYVHSTPESYIRFAHDYDRLRKLPNYLALEKFSDPPQLSDLKGLSFDSDDVKALKNCKPADCSIQMPATSIEELHKSVDWSSPDAGEQINQILRKTALARLLAYQREGNQALGVYNDKLDPTEVPKQFAFMLSYATALPKYLPEFDHYLLSYPKDKPANVDDFFYWAKVKFGLKPTLRVVQVVTAQGSPTDDLAYAIAEKQLYSSHYFETALDLTFCVRGGDDGKKPGFYLIMVMGSEQAGLTGVKGSIIRKVAVDRSVSSFATLSRRSGIPSKADRRHPELGLKVLDQPTISSSRCIQNPTLHHHERYRSRKRPAACGCRHDNWIGSRWSSCLGIDRCRWATPPAAGNQTGSDDQ